MKKNTALKIILAMIVCAIILLAGNAVRHRIAQKNTADALPINTKMGGDFVLPSTQGKPLNTADLRGKVLLLNFGFTSCPDVCPLVLARLRQVLRDLGGDAATAQIVFVSFDPARDTLPNLTAYVNHFDKRIIGATGTDVDIAKLAARYGVVYLKENNAGSAAGYNFSHSDYIYLIDAQGRIRKLYSNDAPVAEVVNDVRALQAAQKSFWQF